jgi:D-3-phosphoglycerate dehydrogenase
MGVVAVTDHVFPHLDQERAILAEAGHELRFGRNARSPDEVLEAVRDADGILNCYAQIPAPVIRELRRCRIIARYGVGLDTIDIPEATAKGIVVTNVPDYCVDEVSDHALALILSLARGVARLDRGVRAGGWDLGEAGPLHRIRGRTLGLVGFGRIARSLARKARALGFDVVASDPFVSAAQMSGEEVRGMSLEDLLAQADVVSLHAPLTPETHHVIGRRELSRMKRGTLLINTSRGPLVDLGALLASLEDGHLGGAGLDVLEGEPLEPGHPLFRRPEVVVTPHAAFYSEESVAEQQRKAAEQVVAALAGVTPPYAINMPSGR